MRSILLQEIFGAPLIRAIGWTLIHSLWQGLLFAILAGAIILITRRSGAGLRYNLLATLFFLFLLLSGYTFLREWEPRGAGGVFVVRHALQNSSLVNIVPGIEKEPMRAVAQNYLDVFISYFNEHAALVVMIWFIIFCARFVKLLANVGYMQRIRHYKTSAADPYWQEKLKELAWRLQIKKPVRLLQSGLVKVPMMAGFFKPVILFPVSMLTRLSPGQIEAVLLHELAHIRRKDYLVNLFQHFVEIVFFFNPGILWISSLIRDERENCCDDLAVGQTNDHRKFIQALLAFQEFSLEKPGLATAFPGRKNQLLQRVQRILQHRNQTLNNMEKVFLSGCLCAMAVVTVAFSQTHRKPQATASEREMSGSALVQPVVDPGTANAMAASPNAGKPVDISPVHNLSLTKSTVPSSATNDTTPSKSVQTITIEPDDMIIYVTGGYRIGTKEGKIVEAYHHDQKLSDDQLKEMKPALEKLVEEQKLKSYPEFREPLQLMDLKKSLIDAELQQKHMELMEGNNLLEQKTSAEKLFMEDKIKKFKEDQNAWQEKWNDDLVNRQHLLQKEQLRNLDLLKMQQDNLKKLSKEWEEQNSNYIEPILNELEDAGIIKDQKSVSFDLNTEHFIVNGKTQPRETFRRFKEKYIKSPKDYIIYKAKDGSQTTRINIDR